MCYTESIKNKLKLFSCDSYEKMNNDKELKIIMRQIRKIK